ncbi:hypothetical protein GA0115252_149626 [Streptomyces sp. DfronAA-171]|nr:hypothetical protein GA0115252_149626 [Streptomyces sp. DfronAA-171]
MPLRVPGPGRRLGLRPHVASGVVPGQARSCAPGEWVARCRRSGLRHREGCHMCTVGALSPSPVLRSGRPLRYMSAAMIAPAAKKPADHQYAVE